MVQLFKFLLKGNQSFGRAHFRPNFLDKLRLTVQGGHGGNGVPKYGGVGGQGGCVYFVAKEGVTLRRLSQKLREKRASASSGEDSSKMRIIGKRGMDERIEVPIGVQVIDESDKKVLGDLNEDNASCIAAGGGMGGCSGTNYIGKPGENRIVTLDLKLIADVGLVGFPNAGKSTFLKAVSNANPKIASYPFTTIRPQIGTIEFPDLRSITVGDLPGLIEGAHANFGMGHTFLKHIERTRLLLIIVDIFGFRLSPQHEQRTCLQNVYALNKELEMYDTSLLEKPCVLLLNKMDVEGAEELLKAVQPKLRNLEDGLAECPLEIRPNKLIKFERVISISAKNASRIHKVKQDLRLVLDKLVEENQVADAGEIHAMLYRKVGERGPKVT